MSRADKEEKEGRNSGFSFHIPSLLFRFLYFQFLGGEVVFMLLFFVVLFKSVFCCLMRNEGVKGGGALCGESRGL